MDLVKFSVFLFFIVCGCQAVPYLLRQSFPWDEDYSEPIITYPPLVTVSPIPLPPVTTTRRPLTSTPSFGSTTESDPFPWDMDYPESIVTKPQQQTTKPPITSGSQVYPWDDDYPDIDSSTSSPSSTILTTVQTTTKAPSTTSGPFPWEDDYDSDVVSVTPPSLSSTEADVTRPTSSPIVTSRPGDGLDKPEGPEETETTVAHRPDPSTTTQRSATLVYFPGPSFAPIFSAKLNATLFADLPCTTGSLMHRLQCMSQYVWSFG